MKKLTASLACMVLSATLSAGQKGKAAPDYYPLGYSGDTWSGKVTAFDNGERTLTLAVAAKKPETFVVYIPDAPYEWTHDLRHNRVLDFPCEKGTKSQVFKYTGFNGAPADVLPGSVGPSTGMITRTMPPDSNRIEDFASFLGREVIVYYANRKRSDGTAYSEAWRIEVLKKK